MDIDPKLLIAQVTNFLIFLFVFKKFIAKPFTNFVNTERKKEEERERILEELETKENRMQEEEKKWRLEMQEEKEKILADTKKVADQLKTDTLAQTKRETEEMIAKAEKQINSERQTMYNDIKKRTIDLSTYIVEKGLKDYLTEDIKKSLTKHIVQNLGDDVKEVN
jgi:F-type H+-transporting ATPase subunit b